MTRFTSGHFNFAFLQLFFKKFFNKLFNHAAVCYAFSVVQTKSSASRLWYLFNPLSWLIYDLFTKAYGNFILHVVIFFSTLFAILRNDCKKEGSR